MMAPSVGGGVVFRGSVGSFTEERTDLEVNPKMMEYMSMFDCFTDTIKSIAFSSTNLFQCLSLVVVNFLSKTNNLDKALA